MPHSALTQVEKDSLLATLWDRSLIGVSLLCKDGRFLRANPAFCAAVEYNEAELQNRKFYEIMHPEDTPSLIQLTDEIAGGRRENVMVKARYLTKTGRVIWALISVEKLEVDGEFHYFVNQVSEVLTVNHVQVPVLIARKPLMEPLLKLIRENYPWVLLLLGAVAYTAAEILKHL
jgi:PAS domain S-box-containing protein